MSYKVFILLLMLTFSCTNQNLNKKKSLDPVIYQKYSNNGFALIYSDDLFKSKIVNKKLHDRELFVLQKNFDHYSQYELYFFHFVHLTYLKMH